MAVIESIIIVSRIITTNSCRTSFIQFAQTVCHHNRSHEWTITSQFRNTNPSSSSPRTSSYVFDLATKQIDSQPIPNPQTLMFDDNCNVPYFMDRGGPSKTTTTTTTAYMRGFFKCHYIRDPFLYEKESCLRGDEDWLGTSKTFVTTGTDCHEWWELGHGGKQTITQLTAN